MANLLLGCDNMHYSFVLYNDNLLKLDAVELKKFDELKKVMGDRNNERGTSR